MKKEDKMKQFHIERVTHIHDSDTGNHFYIGPDADGLGGVEIRDVSPKGTVEARFWMGKDQAVLVARAILEMYTGGVSGYYLDVGR